MDDGDRRTPVALARDSPVAKPILNLAPAPAGGLGPADYLGACLFRGQTVEEAGIDCDARGGLRFGYWSVASVGLRRHHTADREAEFLGELEVAHVVPRNAVKSARTIVHQHEIGDPDRYPPILVE